MWIVAGLGNPGSEYAMTRHNVGFVVLDLWQTRGGLTPWKKKWKAEISEATFGEEKLLLIKPMTFMNLSGESVLEAAQFYKIPPQKIIAIHDDIDLPFGQLRIQQNRGAGGHNGIKSIAQTFATQDFVRLKFGVGRPPVPGPDVGDYVLQRWLREEEQALFELSEKCIKAIEILTTKGLNQAASIFNQTKSEVT